MFLSLLCGHHLFFSRSVSAFCPHFQQRIHSLQWPKTLFTSDSASSMWRSTSGMEKSGAQNYAFFSWLNKSIKCNTHFQEVVSSAMKIHCEVCRGRSGQEGSGRENQWCFHIFDPKTWNIKEAACASNTFKSFSPVHCLSMFTSMQVCFFNYALKYYQYTWSKGVVWIGGNFPKLCFKISADDVIRQGLC